MRIGNIFDDAVQIYPGFFRIVEQSQKFGLKELIQ